MAYVKHDWVSGETITATELNKIESGIGNNSERLDELTETVNKNTTDIDGKLDKSSVTSSLTSTSTTDALSASAGKTLNDALTRKYVGSIAGGGVLEICANVCILQFTVTQYDPNGAVIPSEYRPKFENRCWNMVAVTGDYANTYVVNVGNDGSVQMQKNGVTVTQSVTGVRGQITWAI